MATTKSKKRDSTLPGTGADNASRARRLTKLRRTLPGEGLSSGEKAQRLAIIPMLEAVIDADKSSKSFIIYSKTPGQQKLPTAKELLERLSTGTLNRLADKYPDNSNTLSLTDALESIMSSGEWRYTAGHSQTRLQAMMLDMVSFHQYLVDPINSAECRSTSFRKVYEVTGHEPGTLDSLTGQDRAGVEALLFVASSRLDLLELNPFRYISPVSDGTTRATNELPKQMAHRILESPEIAHPLVEYMNSRELRPAEVEWDDFLSYMDINAPLREGAL